MTPSFNALGYLPRCVASVGDQEDVSCEHIVIDGNSTDGTAAWLGDRKGLRYVSEPDRGMYDAINKGLRLGRGQFLAYLNCDEQYLPGALASVRACFAQHPQADIVFGGALQVDDEGELISFRKAYPIRSTYILVQDLYLLSCAMFLRRKVIDRGHLFDPRFRAGGDADFVVRVLKAGVRPAYLHRFLAAFTMTGDNLSEAEQAQREGQALKASAPRWTRAGRPLLALLRRLEKLAHGAYWEKMPLSYALYVDPGGPRKMFTARKASPLWGGTGGR